MDPNSSYNIEFRIVAKNTHASWFSLNEVLDADVANYSNVVSGIVDKYPGCYGDVFSLFYWCHDTKMNIPLTNDQQLLEMFAKNKASKCCYMTLAYHKPNTDPPVIPSWDTTAKQSVEPTMTPSMPCPSFAEPSQTNSENADDAVLANPNPKNEYVGVNEEGLHIDLGPQHPPPPQPQSQPQPTSTQNECPSPDRAACNESDSDDRVVSDDSPDRAVSDDDYEIDPDDLDEMVKDHEPDLMAPADYDRNNPSMAVGSMFADMFQFKMALATHAAIRENRYFIQKSDTGRYRVYCHWRNDGCPWRIHASTMRDGKTI